MDFRQGGQVIQCVRKRRGMTQEQLAEKAAIEPNSISRIERGVLAPSLPTQCNSKFKGEKRCSTPTLDTETIQRLFVKAYNQLMQGQRQVIADCELVRRKLTDFKTLDADIERQLEETQVVSGLVKAAIQENASTAQSQETYRRRYEALVKRYEAAAAELERLQSLRTAQSQQDKAMALFIRTLKKQPVVLEEWDDTIWTVMVEKAVVHKDGQITFVFYNGSQITVGA